MKSKSHKLKVRILGVRVMGRIPRELVLGGGLPPRMIL